ncbi:MAG: glutamine synthetase family protein [Candidatus Ornithospirochaeta sp.]
MKYTAQEIKALLEEEEVEFVRLEFTDVFGKPRSMTIMPGEFERAMEHGISIDGSAIPGLGGDNIHSDIFLRPDLDSISFLPWRPDQGKAVRFFSYIYNPDGTPFEADSRRILKNAVDKAEEAGFTFSFGTEFEFYLFNSDAKGNCTREPIDNAGYMDSVPDDKGDSVRREVCLMLKDLGMKPEGAHHEEGPGQNEIDFSYASPLAAADNAVTFCQVVKQVSARNGLYVDFSPKPLSDKAGNGLHINLSAKSDGEDVLEHMIAGILKYIRPMTLFLNPTDASYRRLGSFKAPRYISASRGNRSQLVRIPEARGEYVRAEVRSPDAGANPYIAFALLINAGLEGIKNRLPLSSGVDQNLFLLSPEELSGCDVLPSSLKEAKEEAASSSFVKSVLPASVVDAYLK